MTERKFQIKITQKGPSQITKFYKQSDESRREEAESTITSVAHNRFNKM
jgi:hypothetical protein